VSPTVQAKKPGVVIGPIWKKPGLSASDIRRIHKLYKCKGRPHTPVSRTLSHTFFVHSFLRPFLNRFLSSFLSYSFLVIVFLFHFLCFSFLLKFIPFFLSLLFFPLVVVFLFHFLWLSFLLKFVPDFFHSCSFIFYHSPFSLSFLLISFLHIHQYYLTMRGLRF
jgi:hypothetical protein